MFNDLALPARDAVVEIYWDVDLEIAFLLT